MYQETSRQAFKSLEAVNEKQKAVLNALMMLGKATDVELSTLLDWPINRVTPRRGELFTKGLIEVAGTKLQNNRTVIVWQPSEKQLTLF